MRWCSVQTNEYYLQAITYPTICAYKLHNNDENKIPVFPECICNTWQNMMYVTNISDTRPRKNMITMGKVDTSDLMMIIKWAINISFQSPELKWVSWTHTTPYISMTKVIERTSSMLDTPPQDKLYRRLQVFNACELSCTMIIMGGSKCLKTKYDLKAICILPMTYPQKLYI